MPPTLLHIYHLNTAAHLQVLLLDEPTSGCDAAAALALERLVAASGVAAVWISHDPAQVICI